LSDFPSVSVIVVNYNGIVYLPACLDALKNQTYPADRYEVIVSDNQSTDGSLMMLEQDYPWVKVIANKTNRGFAGGNNIALKAAKGDYFLLINNDTAAAPDWIEKMVEPAMGNEKAGIITGHLHLFYDQLTISIDCDPFTPPGDGRELGVKIFDLDSGVFRGVYQYLNGFYGREIDAYERRYRWSKGKAEIGIPVPLETTPFNILIKISAPRPGDAPVRCRISDGDNILSERVLQSDEMVEWRLEIPTAIRLRANAVEQNTGSIVFKSGYGRDRGTYVKNGEVLFEEDRGQYSKLEEVFAGCGANFLIKQELIEQIGGFDDDFFMYYEDIDLCWRARLAGWKVLYAPDAIVRHVHCGTTVEWSKDFFYLTERNRVAMVLKNGGFIQILRVSGSFFRSLFAPVIKACWNFLRQNPIWRQQARLFITQLKVAVTIIKWLPSLWKKRVVIRKYRAISYTEIESWLCQQAQNG